MDNAQIQMQLEKVKDDLGHVEYRAHALDEQMAEFSRLVNEIRNDLAILKEKLK